MPCLDVQFTKKLMSQWMGLMTGIQMTNDVSRRRPTFGPVSTHLSKDTSRTLDTPDRIHR